MKRPVPVLIPFLVFISAVFIGILIFTYIETKKANPQMLETGKLQQAPPVAHALACPVLLPEA